MPIGPLRRGLRWFVRHFEGLRHEVPANSKAANRLGIVQDHVELDFGALYAAVRYITSCNVI